MSILVTSKMIKNRAKWTLIPGVSITLIFLNGILPASVVIAIQFFLLLFMVKKIKVPFSFLIIFLCVLVQGIVCIIQGNDTFSLFLKQYICIGISVVYWLTCINKKNIDLYIQLYKKFSVFTAIVAIAQYIFSLIGLDELANMSWLIKSQGATPVGRTAAFLNEPSTCALVLFPMVFLSIYSWIGKNKRNAHLTISNWEKIVIVIGFITTGSSSGFIGVAFALIIISLEYGINYKVIFIVLSGVLLLGFFYKNVPLINVRVNDTYYTLTNRENVSYANVSTQTLVLNKDVAFENFKETKGLGGGLGSHQIAYNKYINLFDTNNLLHLNQQDANSMLLRIISELGILGFVIAAFFLVGYRYRKNNNQKDMRYKVLSLMCLSYILMRFARFGHYFDCGFFMFVVIYYRCYEISKSYRK